MFLTAKREEDERVYAIKPMNCPGHVQIFKNGLKSYRDLPLKIAEFGKVHRFEPSGALHGLLRVRAFTQDDAHIFITEGQIAEVNLNAQDFLSRAAQLLKRGFVITVDYGAERDELLNAPHRIEGTLRAFQRHRLMDDLLANPGAQDLTTTVDWKQIRDAGALVGLETLRHEQLDKFLLAEGLLDELEMVTSGLSDLDALCLRTSAREMIMPHGLAASFQVLIQEKRP